MMRHAKASESPHSPNGPGQAGPSPQPLPFQPRPPRSPFGALLKAALVSALFWAAVVLLVLRLR
jgi:hypothetical protein